MKRIGSLIAAVCMLLLLLTACGQQAATESSAAAPAHFDPAQVETVADLLPFLHDSEESQTSANETRYIMAFKADDVYYRAVAEMPEGMYDKISDVEYDDDHDATVEKMLSPLKVQSVENLNDKIPSQEELDKLVGKTSSPNYGELFEDIFLRAGKDFFYVDHDVHSVAKIQIHNVNTGRAFVSGEINYELLEKSFLY